MLSRAEGRASGVTTRSWPSPAGPPIDFDGKESGAPRTLARLTLVVQGKRILVRTTDGNALVDATSGGQVVISLSVAPIAEDLRGKVTELRSPREINVRVGGRSFVAVLTPDLAAGGYSIEVPGLPGVVTEADSLPEARRMTADAIRLWQSVADSPVRRRAR